MTDFLNPQSIAVIGASRNPQKLGAAIIKNIINYGFGGRLYPINPQAKRIFHLKCYPSVLKVEDKIDLAIIVVPANIVSLVLDECGQKEIPHVVIISAGFREQGRKGLEREQEILRLKGEYKLQILGPNCLGFINTLENLNATFSASQPVKGNIAFMSQSGALASSILDLAEKTHLGFSYFVSLGNKLDLNELDLLTNWAEDKKLKSIFAYLEDIRVGKQFLAKAREISLEKPIVVLMPGRSQEAKQAISSHTGSIAGNHEVIETGFTQNGIICTSSLDTFFNLMIVFNNFPVSFGERVGIITNAGGPAVIATEDLIRKHLKLARFSSTTIKNLGEHLPATVNIRDPLDVVGDALSDRYDWALYNLILDKNVDVILVLLTPQFMTEIKKTAEAIVKYAKQKKKLILTSFMGGTKVESGVQILQNNKVAHFSNPHQAIEILAKLITWQKWQQDNQRRLKLYHFNSISTHQKMKVKEVIGDKKNQYLTDEESLNIMQLYEIPTVHCALAKNRSMAENLTEMIKFPLVMKFSSPKLIHKTDFGGIILNVQNKHEVATCFDRLMRNGRQKTSSAFIEGVLIQEMLKDGLEVIIGVKKDANFGHLLMFGSGGVYTEIYRDVAFRLLPTDRFSLEKMMSETKIFKVLDGFRGKEYPLVKIKDILMQIQQLIIDFPEISELDINPLWVHQDYVKVVDVKIKIE